MQATCSALGSFRSRGRVIVYAIALVALSAMLFMPGAASAETAEVEPAATPATTTNYLALGDSITFGYTEEKFNINYPNERRRTSKKGSTTSSTKTSKNRKRWAKAARSSMTPAPVRRRMG